MASFWLVIVAGLAWMALTKDMTFGAFAAGAFMGIAVWRIEHLKTRQRFSLSRAPRFLLAGIILLGHFLVEILIANLEQLRIVFSPTIEVKPRWIRMRTELETAPMRATLGLMIAMTPGSVCCEETEEPDGSFSIGIHALNAEDDESLVARIRSKLETPLRRMERL